jgi:hypothetical protein
MLRQRTELKREWRVQDAAALVANERRSQNGGMRRFGLKFRGLQSTGLRQIASGAAKANPGPAVSHFDRTGSREHIR